MTAYDEDLAAWAMEQAGLLRDRAGDRLDWDNIAEEIEGVGSSQRREVVARLARLCEHLLRWQVRPEHQSRSWRVKIRRQRRALARVLKDSPSLRPYAAAELDDAFAAGREDAESETGLLRLPRRCPWSVDQVLDSDYMPEA